jgi:acetyl esterase/lipase
VAESEAAARETTPPESPPQRGEQAQGPEQDPPFELPGAVELREGIVYATPGGVELRLDLFLPRERPVGGRGVVYVHGGGWRGGTRRQFWRQAAHMAALGCVGACIQYRLVPQYAFPAQWEDAQAAVRWLRRHAAGYGVDGGRIGAVGGSAGAHLAAMLGTTDTVVDGTSSRAQAVVAFNGAFDLAELLELRTGRARDPVLNLLGGDPAQASLASPAWHADARAAPTLLLHGEADETIPIAQSRAFASRLQQFGVAARVYAEPGAAHGFFNRTPYYQRTLPEMERFLLKTL